MSAYREILRKAFGGRANIFDNVIISTAAPTSANKIGTLCWDKTNENAYICTVAAGTWVAINA